MKVNELIVVTLLALILVGCSENPTEETKQETTRYPYPETTEELKTETSYKLYYTGEKTGVRYYIKEISNEELDKIPFDDPVQEHIISGPQVSRIYVPIKDGQIVEIDDELMGDIIALGMKTAFEDEDAKNN